MVVKIRAKIPSPVLLSDFNCSTQLEPRLPGHITLSGKHKWCVLFQPLFNDVIWHCGSFTIDNCSNLFKWSFGGFPVALRILEVWDGFCEDRNFPCQQRSYIYLGELFHTLKLVAPLQLGEDEVALCWVGCSITIEVCRNPPRGCLCLLDLLWFFTLSCLFISWGPFNTCLEMTLPRSI